MNSDIIDTVKLLEKTHFYDLIRTVSQQVHEAQENKAGYNHVNGRKIMKHLVSIVDPVTLSALRQCNIDKSLNASVFIVSPFQDSDLIVISLHDRNIHCIRDGAHAITIRPVDPKTLSDDDANKYVITATIVLAFDTLLKSEVPKIQITRHEVTHYVLSYLRLKGIDIPLSVEHEEFICDYAQFMCLQEDKLQCLDMFEDYVMKYIKKSVQPKYKPYIEQLREYYISQK